MLKTGPKSLIAKPIIGRETLGVELWATGKIEATPFGCFANMMSTQSHGSNETEMKKQAMRSSKVTFDHFNYPYGKEALDREMPLGKKTVPHHEMADTNSRVFNM